MKTARLHTFKLRVPTRRLHTCAARSTLLQCLFARYARAQGVQRGLEMLLAAAEPSLVHHTLHRYGVQSTTLQFAPRFLVSRDAATHASERILPHSPALLIRQLESRTLEQIARNTNTSEVLHRFERVEASVRSAPPSLVAAERGAGTMSDAAALVRAMPVTSRINASANDRVSQSSNLPPTMDAARAAHAPTLTNRTASEATRIPLADNDITRLTDNLTDKVMQNIDRRIVAHRERFGRP